MISLILKGELNSHEIESFLKILRDLADVNTPKSASYSSLAGTERHRNYFLKNKDSCESSCFLQVPNKQSKGCRSNKGASKNRNLSTFSKAASNDNVKVNPDFHLPLLEKSSHGKTKKKSKGKRKKKKTKVVFNKEERSFSMNHRAKKALREKNKLKNCQKAKSLLRDVNLKLEGLRIRKPSTKFSRLMVADKKTPYFKEIDDK